MNVVFDANVLIPMVLDGSTSTRLYRRLKSAGHDVATSEQILDEVREKMRTKQSLRRWLDITDERIEEYLADLPKQCALVPGIHDASGSVPADPDDEKVIATALESKASYIVSEDRHLRDLKEYDGIPILSRTEFEAELDRLGVPQLD